MTGRWDQQPWLIERICTCDRGQRCSECHRSGYHAVDGAADRWTAESIARDLIADVGVAYRVIEASTDRVVWAGRR